MAGKRTMSPWVAAGVFLMPVPAAAQADMTPHSAWVVDHGEKGCVAQRQFGTGRDALTLALEPAPYSRAAALILVGDRTLPRQPGSTRITLERDGAQVTLDGWNAAARSSGRLIRAALFGDDLAVLRGTDAVTVTIGGRPPMRLSLGYGSKLQEAIDACEAGLLTHWGVDPATLPDREAASQLRPRGDPGRWLNSSDYPAGAMSDGQEGAVALLLWVDPQKGRVTDCRGTMLMGLNGWDGIACDLIKQRARYVPVPDKAGPVLETMRVRFRMAG